jgi:hypothetical protein
VIDLREHLQELADAAARHGDTPGPAAAIRRGRQRRRRIVGVVAAVLAVTVAVGSGVTGRLAVPPDLPVTAPALPPLPKLDLRSGSPAPPAEMKAAETLAAEVRRCPGGLGEPTMLGYFRSAELRRLVMIVAKPLGVGDTTVCWAAGVFDLKGAGWAARPVRPSSVAIPLTARVERSAGYGAVYGQVDPRAVRVRVRFRGRPSLLEVAVVQTRMQFGVNLYVGLFQPGWVPVELTAFDAEGRQLTGCAVGPRPGRCPEP